MDALFLAELAEDQRERFLARPCGTPREQDFDRWLDMDRVVAVIGVRRCGKSTLLRQFAERLGGEFHYLNFDDERLAGFAVADFEAMLHAFHGRSPVRTLLFDEIQNVPQWERFIRRAHDDGYKIFLTGSNAHLLSEELATRLTGRCAHLPLTPFTFGECLNFAGISRTSRTTAGKAAILAAFGDYLKTGGFPGYLKERDLDILQQVYEDILYRDIVARHGIRDVRGFAQTAHYFFSTAGAEMNYSKVSAQLSIPSANTIRQYAGFLESACLLGEIRRFDWSLKRQYISGRKLYAVDNGLQKAVAFQPSPDYGRSLEMLVFQELKRRYRDVWFFREKGECDFIVRDADGGQPGLYQVCYTLTPENRDREWRGLCEAGEKLGVNAGTIITLAEEGSDKSDGMDITLRPAWRWLLEHSGSGAVG